MLTHRGCYYDGGNPPCLMRCTCLHTDVAVMMERHFLPDEAHVLNYRREMPWFCDHMHKQRLNVVLNVNMTRAGRVRILSWNSVIVRLFTRMVCGSEGPSRCGVSLSSRYRLKIVPMTSQHVLCSLTSHIITLIWLDTCKNLLLLLPLHLLLLLPLLLLSPTCSPCCASNGGHEGL